MGFIERWLRRERCSACGRWRKIDDLDIYITRKLRDEGHVDFALNYCNDNNYCIKHVVKLPRVGW